MKRSVVWFATTAILLAVVFSVGAEEPELDPLLELLVEQGVITMEQTLAVQAEYDRRRAAEQAPVVVPLQTVETDPTAPLAQQEEQQKVKDDSAIRALAVAGQGDLVLSSAADGTLRLWRLDEDFAVTITVAKSEWAAFTDDGKYFGSEYASTLLHRVWDTANGPVIEQLPVDPRGDELRTQLGLRPARAARTE